MNIYIGTFLIAFATLALEITFTRLLSVITWYHLAFFAISTAMLGMTAGATTVYLKPIWFTKEKLNNSITKSCLGYSLSTPLALIILCLTPLHLAKSVMSLFALLVATIACSLPFYFSGIAITAILTKSQLPIGKLYASDLIGASLGCLFVLGGLEFFDAPSLILLCGSIGVLAGINFSWNNSSKIYRRLNLGIFIFLVLLALINSSTMYGIRPFAIKGEIVATGNYILEKWNSFSRVVISEVSEKSPQYWGASPLAPKDEKIFQYDMNIDGDATTTLRRFSTFDDIKHLHFDLPNLAYHIRSTGGACIIGTGGGRDVQSAILFGHNKIVGIDVNPIFINLLQNEFREFAGIANRKDVTLIVDEARSYLSRTEEKYSIIQMSLIDTWAATGAGAFSLSENALYTVEAWQVFFQRLANDGIFTVSRWYSPENLGETGRIVSLAVASLIRYGVQNPSHHIAMATSEHLSTLLISKQPFSNQDIAKLKKVSSDLQFDLVILPNVKSYNTVLRDIVSSNSLEELSIAIEDKSLNYEPPTDDNPYFFNMLRLRHIPSFFQVPGVGRGNLIATVSLAGLILSLLILTLITIVLPLITISYFNKIKKRAPKILWSGALYFSLIGAGFMFVEIALIQRLSIFLSHPVYALGILLFTIIASTGIGSYLSEHLPVKHYLWIFMYVIFVVLAILIMQLVLPILISNLINSDMTIKILVSIIIIFPLGILLGIYFPVGIRMVRSISHSETPWYWALNGIFGVLCSALAVFFSIYFGISTNFYIAAICYGMLLPCIFHIYSKNRNQLFVNEAR
jgi:spermidine synthase